MACAKVLLQDRETLNHINFEKGKNIFIEGHPAACSYLIVKGAVELSYDKGDQTMVVRHAQKGELIGELDWINMEQHLFTAKAVEPVACVKVPYKNLISHYLDSPPSIQGILRNTVNTLRGLKGEDRVITNADVQSIANDQIITLPQEGSAIDDVLGDADTFAESMND